MKAKLIDYCKRVNIRSSIFQTKIDARRERESERRRERRRESGERESRLERIRDGTHTPFGVFRIAGNGIKQQQRG